MADPLRKYIHDLHEKGRPWGDLLQHSYSLTPDLSLEPFWLGVRPRRVAPEQQPGAAAFSQRQNKQQPLLLVHRIRFGYDIGRGSDGRAVQNDKGVSVRCLRDPV
jgi:hypothetical protein